MKRVLVIFFSMFALINTAQAQEQDAEKEFYNRDIHYKVDGAVAGGMTGIIFTAVILKSFGYDGAKIPWYTPAAIGGGVGGYYLSKRIFPIKTPEAKWMFPILDAILLGIAVGYVGSIAGEITFPQGKADIPIGAMLGFTVGGIIGGISGGKVGYQLVMTF